MKQRAIFAVILILATALRLFHLDAVSFGYDEIGQVLVSRASWLAAITGAASHAGAAPLDYILTHALLTIGNSDIILRLPDVLFGVLAVAAIYLLMKQLCGYIAGALAAFILAILPMHIAFSQTARFYSLATCMALAVVLVFWYAAQRNSRRWWLAYGVVLTLGLYAHYYLALVAVALWLWCLCFRRAALWPITLASVVAGLLFLPYAYYDNVVVTTGALSLDTAGLRFYGGLPKLLAGPFIVIAPSATNVSYLPPAIWATVYALWGLALLGLPLLFFRSVRARLALPLLVLLVGLPGILALDYVGSYNVTGRQTLIFAPFIIMAAVGTVFALLERIPGDLAARQRTQIYAGAACAIAIAVALMPQVAGRYAPGSGDERAVAQFLDRTVGPDDVIVVGFPDHLAYYAPALRPQMVRIRLADIDQAIADLAAGHPRLWLVPWLPTWEPALTDWSLAHGATDVSPFGRAIFVYATDPAAAPALVTELLHAPTLPDEQKGSLAAKVGTRLLASGDYTATATLLAPYATAAYATPALWAALGKAYLRLHNGPQAKIVFEQLVAARPNDWEANYQLSNFAIYREDWKRARAYAETGYGSHPTKYGVAVLLGNLLRIYAATGEAARACALIQDGLGDAAANPYLAKMEAKLTAYANDAGCD